MAGRAMKLFKLVLPLICLAIGIIGTLWFYGPMIEMFECYKSFQM